MVAFQHMSCYTIWQITNNTDYTKMNNQLMPEKCQYSTVAQPLVQSQNQTFTIDWQI